jgi:hypothetical protein
MEANGLEIKLPRTWGGPSTDLLPTGDISSVLNATKLDFSGLPFSGQLNLDLQPTDDYTTSILLFTQDCLIRSGSFRSCKT